MMWRAICVQVMLMVLSSAVGVFGSGGTDQAVPGEFTPVYQPRLDVSRVAGSIEVDGRLDDPGWRGAAVAANFAEHYPGDQTKPPVETRAFMTYDEENLYVAFVCDDDPDLVRSSFCEREQIHNDDNVRLCLDTYGSAAWAYVFYVNPHGIQGDGMWAATGGEQSAFDCVWESAGRITDSGYQVEIAIPFTSLRFPNQKNQVWRIDFWRNHPRETQAEYSWAAYDRDEGCWPCQWGTVTGIADVKPGRGIAIIPTVTGHQSGSLEGDGRPDSPYEFINNDPDGDPSIYGKYSLSSNATVEGTVNPDFSQIEADPGQIDVNTTFALFYEERRPFFQEGSDLFRAATYTVYTRSINDPEFAVKATVRSGRTSIGYLMARDRNSPVILPSGERSDVLQAGKSISNIFRLRQTVGSGSQMGMIVTDQRFDGGGSGSSITHDARFRLSPTLRATYHLTASHVTELDDSALTALIPDPDATFGDRYTRACDGETFWGHFAYGSLNWWTRTWNASLAYQESSPTFRQHNGLIRQNDYRNLSSVVGYFFRLPTGLFETINPHVRGGREWDFDGNLKMTNVELNLWTRLRVAQAGFYSQYVRSAEDFGGTQFDDIWFVYQDMDLRFGDLLQLFCNATYGNQIARRQVAMARILNVSVMTGIKPHQRVRIQQWLDFSRATALETDEEFFSGYILRTRADYQVSRPLAARLVVQYDDFYECWSVNPLLTYRLSPYSVFYVGSTYDYEQRPDALPKRGHSVSQRLTSRQFFMKLQYLFQL